MAVQSNLLACPVCGGPGSIEYVGLNDRLLGVAKGLFDTARCEDALGCGVSWITPTPSPSEIAGFYTSYFTHAELPGDVPRFVQRLVRLVWPLPRRRRAIEVIDALFLEGYPPGRVLELGAADGRRLALFRSLGWDAVGLDIDPQSAARARRERGIEVHVGALEPNTFAEGTFDAVVSNHVLEHLPDPVSTLMVVRALLRPGGRLIAVTPNGRSYGQRRFGKDWYGLDAPRHLVIFTVPGLRAAARAAGFQRATVTSTACRAEQVLTRSAEARWFGHLPGRLRTSIARGRSVAPAGSLARPSP